MDEMIWSRRVGRRRKPSTLIIALGGWTDAGDAATLAANAVVEVLGAQPLGHLNPEPYYDFSVVRPQIVLDETGVRGIRWGTIVFYMARERTASPVIVAVGPEPQLKWKSAMTQIVETMVFLGVQEVITLGSLLAATPHTRAPRMVGYSSDPSVRDIVGFDVTEYEGPTGFISVLQSAAEELGISVTSLWVEVPHYLSQFPARRAALTLVDSVELLLDAPLDLTPFRVTIEDADQEIARFVAHDPELAAYVDSLEATYEQERSERASLALIVKEAEQFLRLHGDGP